MRTRRVFHTYPVRHGNTNTVRLCCARQLLAWSLLRQVERVPQHPVHPRPRHHRLLHHRLPVCSLEDLASDAAVLAFRVLPHDPEVNISRFPTGHFSGRGGQVSVKEKENKKAVGTKKNGNDKAENFYVHGHLTPARSRHGRRLIYWSNSRRNLSRLPHRETSSGTRSGMPTAPK